MENHRFLLRLPQALHKRALKRAALTDKSLNQFIENAVAGALNQNAAESLGEFDALVRSARSHFKDTLIGVILFGSQARGDTHDTSDTDVLIVLKSEVALSRDLYRKKLLEREEDSAVQMTLHYTHLPIKPEDAGSLWLECALDGIIIMDSAQTIHAKLSQIRRVIASGEIVRKTSHGQGYWVHK